MIFVAGIHDTQSNQTDATRTGIWLPIPLVELGSIFFGCSITPTSSNLPSLGEADLLRLLTAGLNS